MLARIYLARNQPQKAAAELERVSDVDPDGSYHFLLWRAYKLAGKPAEAEIALDEYHRRRDARMGARLGSNHCFKRKRCSRFSSD